MGYTRCSKAGTFQIGLLHLTLTILVLACSRHPASWRDPSVHTVHFVTLEDRVRLDVLAWGRSGRPIVLLAGSGNTAHVYDDFAQKLVGPYHVCGITRRRFGASDHPASGYTDQRLADDIFAVLHPLKILAPVLIGHSMAGSELTTVASQHSHQLSGLVYRDAARDPSLDALQIDPIRRKLPPTMLQQPEPAEADTKSFRLPRVAEANRRNGISRGPSCEIAPPPIPTARSQRG
jgi:pimeloyl-ACP methyl ester carboxylesterase